MTQPNSTLAKLVLLYVSTYGPTTVDDIRDDLELTYLDTYPVLSALKSQEYIMRQADGKIVSK